MDTRVAHEALAEHCVRFMSKTLKKDICGLHSPGVLSDEVPSLKGLKSAFQPNSNMLVNTGWTIFVGHK